MSLDTGRRLHAHIWNELPIPERIINLVQKLATAEDAIDLDEDGVPIMEWEVGAPIIYEDDNENDFDDINDSDGNDISEIDDYEDDNKDTISKNDDHSNDDDSYEDFGSYENPIEDTAHTEDQGAQRPTRNIKAPKRLTITHKNITGKTYEKYEPTANPSYIEVPKQIQFMKLETPLSHMDKQKLYETTVNVQKVLKNLERKHLPL